MYELKLPEKPVEFYRHGWQSWSLSCWQKVDEALEPPLPRSLRVMYQDMADENYASNFVSSYVGGVKFASGEVWLLSAMPTQTVSTASKNEATNSAEITDMEFTSAAKVFVGSSSGSGQSGSQEYSLFGQTELGSADGKFIHWEVIKGDEIGVFEKYSAKLKNLLPAKLLGKKVWSSWYSFYDKITPEGLEQVLEKLYRVLMCFKLMMVAKIESVIGERISSFKVG